MKKRIPARFLWPLAAVLALLVLLALRGVLRQGMRISISPVSARKSNFHFIPEHWKEARLQQLRQNENFKDIKPDDQMDLFLKLCDWTHAQWPKSVPHPYPLSNAVDILADIRSGKTGGFCGQYAYVLADVLKSMGYFAVRYVEMWSAKGESHFVVEAWSDQFAKWIVLDPMENYYYVLPNSNQPANALEIRAAILRSGKIHARSAGMPRTDQDDKKMYRYANFAVSTRSDLMRSVKPLTVRDRFETFVFFKDKDSDMGAFNGRIPYTHVTSRVEDIYFDCNYVRVGHWIDKRKKRVFFAFSTEGSMFNFAGFALSADRGESWQRSGSAFSLPIPRRATSLWVAPVNMLGRFGRPTRVEIR